MVYKVIFIIFFILSNLYSIRTPVKNCKITSIFAESRYDHFHNGIDFGGGQQNVYPVMDGEILFYYDKSEFPFDNYSGAGNLIVLKHKNYLSYYFHLKDDSIIKDRKFVSETNIIGITSDTGHSSGIHLHFTLERIKPKEILNPAEILSELIKDNQKPVIKSLFLKTGESKIKLAKKNLIKSDSEGRLILDCYDIWNYKNYKLGVYKIELYIDGKKIKEIKFDKLIFKNNEYLLNGKYRLNDLLSEDGYILGDIKILEKETSIEIVVSDYSGNSIRSEYKIIGK
jgi:murein DD-endopeptidase MepM/ murein hydrolase activator NlpD